MNEKILNQYLKAISRYTYLLSEEEYSSFKNDENYSYISSTGKDSKISLNLLNLLVKDERLYNYFKRMVEIGSASLRFACVKNGDVSAAIRINVVDALKILDRKKLNDSNIDELRKKCSKDALFNKYKNDFYTIKVDGDELTFSSIELLNLFFMNVKDFKNELSQKNIMGVKPNKVAYVLENFLADNSIFERYLVDEKYYRRFLKLKNQMIVDYEAINRYDKQELIRYNVELNKKLKKLVYEGMNPNYNDLEKSIYIYIKLCKCFSYDPVFYASNQRGEIAEFHEDINRLSKVKGKEDLVVCYEFNTIYAKFLEDLNIEHRINVKMGQNYGRNHANLDFRVEEFIVFADSVTSIMGSDMVNAKLNMPLTGLKCLNKSVITQGKFERIVDKVYCDVSKQEKSMSDDEYIFDLLNLYRTFSLNKKLDINEKVKLLLDEVNASKMKTMDSLGYMVKLKKMIFNKLELLQNVSMVIAQSRFDRKKFPIVIITINEKEDMNFSDNNKYYCYTPGIKMMEYTKEEIEELFNNGSFSYLDNTKPRVPNIKISNNKRGEKNDSRTKR